MTEILTESFCERCGTRYTFEPVEQRRRSFGRIGTLGRGIRNFVSDPNTSLDEAFAVARSEQEQQATNHALEAFHSTFNFCLTCRQYTCGDCWNTVEGRCLTCAPTSDSVAVPEPRMDTTIPLLPFEQPRALVPIVVEGADGADNGPWIGSEDDLRGKFGPAGKPADPAATDFDAIWASSVIDEPAVGAEPQVDAEALAEWPTAVEPALVDEWATPVVAATSPFSEGTALVDGAPLAADAGDGANWPFSATDPLRDMEAPPVAEAAPVHEAVELEALAPVEPRLEVAGDEPLAFEPGENLDEQLAEYERRMAAESADTSLTGESLPEAAEVAAEPVAAEVEPVAEEAEPVTTEPAAEPVAAESEPEVVTPPAAVEPAAELPIAAAAATPAPSVEPIPTAIGQPFPASILDGPLAWPDPGVAAAAFEPHWPDIPVPRRRPTEPPPVMMPPLPTPPSRTLRRTGANLPSVDSGPAPIPAHSCPSCGLSLSANARFCRRCGTPQQVAAAR